MNTTKRQSEQQSTTTKDFIDEVTSTHQVVVFAKSWCASCIRAKAVFESTSFQNVDVHYVHLDELENGRAVMQELYLMTGQRTVPNVWVNGRFLGGNEESEEAFLLSKSGHLAETNSRGKNLMGQ